MVDRSIGNKFPQLTALRLFCGRAIAYNGEIYDFLSLAKRSVTAGDAEQSQT